MGLGHPLVPDVPGMRRRPAAPGPLTIGEALRDRHLLGALPAFRRLETWAPWLTFLDAVYGQPLDAVAEARFCRHTGRSRYAPPGNKLCDVR